MDDFKIKRITIMFMKGLRLKDIPTTDDMFNRRVFDEERADMPALKMSISDMKYDSADAHVPKIINGRYDSAFIAPFNTLYNNQYDQEYKSLPREYSITTHWPQTSNCKCWYCDLNFSTVPIFVPTNFYINKSGNEEFTTEGNFCTFNCAQKYINLTYLGRNNNHETYTRLLRKLYFKFTGHNIKKIIESPDKTLMKQYCGENGITPTEYRIKINELNELYKITL